MFRVWGKVIKDNRLVMDHVVVIEDYTISRTQKVYQALDELCYTFDLAKPIWLETNISDFKKHARTKFTADSFVEEIEFDYLDFQVIEEEY